MPVVCTWHKVYQDTYFIILIIRNRKAGPGWISYLGTGAFYTDFSITRTGAFYTDFSITTPDFLIFL